MKFDPEYYKPIMLDAIQMYHNGKRHRLHKHLRSVKYIGEKTIYVEAYLVGPQLTATISEVWGYEVAMEYFLN